MKKSFLSFCFWFAAFTCLAQNSKLKIPGYPDMDSLYAACIGMRYQPAIGVTTLDGKRFTNASFTGKVTLLNFWFEGCWACRIELPKLNELYDSLKTDPQYQFVSITFDSVNTLPDFIKKNGIRYPVATTMSKAESKKLNYTMGFPSSIILDRNGKIAFIATKAIADKEGDYRVNIHRILAIMRKMKQDYAKIPGGFK